MDVTTLFTEVLVITCIVSRLSTIRKFGDVSCVPSRVQIRHLPQSNWTIVIQEGKDALLRLLLSPQSPKIGKML